MVDERAKMHNNAGVAIIRKAGALNWNEAIYTKALAEYGQALEIDPDYAIAWLNKGEMLQELGRFDEAIVCYNKALELGINSKLAGRIVKFRARALRKEKNHRTKQFILFAIWGVIGTFFIVLIGGSLVSYAVTYGPLPLFINLAALFVFWVILGIAYNRRR